MNNWAENQWARLIAFLVVGVFILVVAPGITIPWVVLSLFGLGIGLFSSLKFTSGIGLGYAFGISFSALVTDGWIGVVVAFVVLCLPVVIGLGLGFGMKKLLPTLSWEKIRQRPRLLLGKVE